MDSITSVPAVQKTILILKYWGKMENLQKLLADVKLIVEKSRIEEGEARKRGEFFNIFNVLNLSSDETRTHSAFIAELLDPNGSHGLGDQFLQSFVNTIDCLKSWNFNTQSAKVQKERSIGNINEDYSEGGRIDIVVESKGKAILIENKIYAGDQEKQLTRYYSYGQKNHSEGFRLLYLTLTGNKASEDSRGELTLNEDYHTIAYNHEISDWLNRCIELAVRHPLVRETLIQYQFLINQLTMNNMDKYTQEELLKVMADPKNIDAVCSILNMQAKWREYIFNQHVLGPLKERFNGVLDIKQDKKGISLKPYSWSHYWIRIDWGNTLGGNVEIGITTDIPGPKEVQQIDSFKDTKNQNEWWPYGWKQLVEEYRYWNEPQMVDGSLVEYLYQCINKILNEIKDELPRVCK